MLTSANGRYVLVNRTDGNIALYTDGYILWQSQTSRPGQATMQGDGDFVLTDTNGIAWQSGTSGHSGAWLVVQNDGNVVINDETGPIWATDTADGKRPTRPAIVAAGTHALMLKQDGTLLAWGYNGQGQVGDGTQTNRSKPVTIGIGNVMAIAGGVTSSYALMDDGTVRAWGYNDHGQIGDGTTNTRLTPVQVSGLSDIVAIAAGDSYALALDSTGTLWGWGENLNGQLGTGTTSTSELTPVRATAVGTVVAIAVNPTSSTSYALRSDGAVLAWGSNSSGQTGKGSTSSSEPTPIVLDGFEPIDRIASGSNFAMAWRTTGELWAWGYNLDWELNDGSHITRTAPVSITNPNTLQQIASGNAFSIATNATGSVWAWGYNSSGQLGDGTTTTRTSPVLLPGLTDVMAVSAGSYFSLALANDGRVWSWGGNTYGQLGDGSTWDSYSATMVTGPGGELPTLTPTFSQGGGTYSTLSVIISDGTAGAVIHYTTDGSDPTENDPTIASGSAFQVTESMTLKARAWAPGMLGSNVRRATYTMKAVTPSFSPSAGTFGTPTDVTITTSTSGAAIHYTTDGSTPTSASATYAGPVTIGTTATLKAIATKTNWVDSSAQSGTYTISYGTLTTPTATPTSGTFETQVTVTLSADEGATIRYTLDGSTPVSTSTAYTQPLVLSTTKTLKAKAFQTDHTPSAVMTETYTIRVAAPTLSLTSGEYAPGTLVTVTNNEAGATLRLTLTGVDPIATDPVIASGTSLLLGGYTLKVRAFRTGATNSDVAGETYTLSSPMGGGALAAGGSHTLVATPDGLLYAWGQNNSGQVGDGTTTNRTAPRLIQTLTGVTQVSAGTSHTLALTWDGRVFAWGLNTNGRLGDGTMTNRTSPTPITTLSGIVAVAAGGSHSLALTADGHVYAWGLGTSGQLGQGSTASYTSPMLVSSLSNIVAIAAGGTHSLAVTSTGAVYAWGANNQSQLGDGTTTNRTSPVLIAGVTGVVAVSGGTNFSLARTASGALYGWGQNTSGQLGLGSTTNKTTPTLVSGLTLDRLLSAGGTHSLGLRDDGVLLAWGLNSAGQLGDTTTTMRTSPVAVQGPSSVALVAGGGTHSAAVTPDGHVWTWGANASGQLGDGTTTGHSTPADIMTLAGVWGATPTPRLSLAPGTYRTTQTTVVTAMTGAVIHYTTTGATPTESDPVLNSGDSVAIDANLTLGLRAWAPGLAPSETLISAYVLQPETPTATPVAGLFDTAQSITLDGPSGATIHYTLDGSTPTESSDAYTSPIGIGAPATLTAKAFRSGWTPSASLVAGYQFRLPPPVAQPSAGTYPSAQTVTLEGPVGATIHYTLDGSAPSAGSPAYAGPIQIGSSLTLRAIAVEAGWTDSYELVQAYVIDTTGPVITSTYLPPPNSAGWNNTPVTVSFTCTDADSTVTTCPDPITFNTEGANQSVQVTATDAVGNDTTITVSANIDRTVPTVTLSAPSDETETSSASIEVTASLEDMLSGVLSATCNGVAATISSGLVDCAIQLRNGLNIVLVQAIDAAGNGTSASARITRTAAPSAILATPSRYTLAAGETLSPKIVDDVGVAVGGLTWTTDAANVADVDAQGKITAIADGTATITASTASLSADVTVTVVAGQLPLGTERWSLDPLPGYTSARLLAVGITEDGTSFITQESADDGSGLVLRGLNSAGEQTYLLTPPLAAGETGSLLMTDGTGGAMLWAGTNALVYVNPQNNTSWRSGTPPDWRLVGNVAQGPDGTVFAKAVQTDNGSQDVGGWVVGLDGATGAMKFAIPTPLSTHRWVADGCEGVPAPTTSAGLVQSLMRVDTNGLANIVIAHEDTVKTEGPISQTNQFCDPYNVESLTTNGGADLYRVAPDGTYTVAPLQAYASAPVDLPSVTFVTVDGDGGALGYWSCIGSGSGCGGLQGAYVSSGGAVSNYALPVDAPAFVASEDVAYAYDGNGTAIGYNFSTGDVVSTTSGSPIAALDDGRLATVDGSGAISVWDSNGNSAQTGLSSWPTSIVGDWAVGYSPTLGVVAATLTSDMMQDETAAQPIAGGNSFAQFAPVDLRGIWVKGQRVLEAPVYLHTSLRIVPTGQNFWHSQFPDVFANKIRGQWYATIGAGSTDSISCGGFLVAALNRTMDVNEPYTHLEHLQYRQLDENALITDLLEREGQFEEYSNDHPISYECFPDVGENEYNSNSFTEGLLDVTGFPLPAFPSLSLWQYPGWFLPVPEQMFGVQ